MTLQEILKAKNLSDEDVQSVIGEMKQNKIFTAGEENLDIRYGKLKTDFDSLSKQHGESSALIEQMKKDNAGNEALQGKINEYETKMTAMQRELEQTKVDAALKVALLEAKAVDIDHLTFKINEKGEIKLGEDGKIKDIDNTITAMKTQFPSQFSSEFKKKIDENKLPINDTNINNQTINFGKNLLDLTEKIKGSKIATAIIPLGAKLEDSEERLTIESVNDGLDYMCDSDAVALYGYLLRHS